MKRATAFICYAWGSDERYKRLNFLRNYIEERSGKRIEVILDKHSYKDNADFDKLRERIRSYDLIILACTPDLKRIILDPDSTQNKDREVLKEYSIVKERYDEDENSVFLVIFEGTKEKSLPGLFHNRFARRFEEFQLSKGRTGKFFIQNTSKQKFNIFVGSIINTAYHNYEDKSPEYNSTHDALNKLFGLTDNTSIPDSCLVIPDLYAEIRNQTCTFVADRKGSGKSTFIHNFREMDRQFFDENYKRLIPLSAEAFNHINAYDSLISKHADDSSTVEPYLVLSLFWQVYFILHCMIIIRAEIEIHKIEEDDDRYPIFNKVTTKLLKKLGLRTGKNNRESVNDARVPRLTFMAAVEMVDDRFSSALNELRNDNLPITSFNGKFTLKGIIEEQFGEKDTKDFIMALSLCDRSIMISLDGFDTHSEDFRMATELLAKDSPEYMRRKEYEILFFRTMLEVVSQFQYQKTHDSVGDAIGEHMKFCIVLPKDRYDQIIVNDRDIFKKNFATLSWSAQELMELLTKRLECLIENIDPLKKIDKNKDIQSRMENALAFFPGLPTEISMDVNGNTVKMSLFNYVLRASFWRPRDVISNLSRIMALMLKFTDGRWVYNGESLSEENIKLSIKTNAEKIIEDEFIGEYKYVFRNLREVLKELQNLDEQMDVSEFKTILNGIYFDASFSYDLSDVNNQLRVLYQLGVIGLLYSRNIAKHQHYLHYVCFEFNEGMAPFDDFVSYKMRRSTDISIIFNPIFARRLKLNYNTKELIGNWDDSYIRNNHINKESIHRA